MTTQDPKQLNYNKVSNFARISYNIIKYLMANDELTWKLMYYDDSDCWKKPDLTDEQKASLIYDGSQDETKFRLFLDVGQDDSWAVQACILRIDPVTVIPSNYIYGMIPIGFEVLSHYRVNHMSNYQTRSSTMAQRLIEVFNGADVPDVGRIYFDQKASTMCRMTTIGQIPYRGKALTMCVGSMG